MSLGSVRRATVIHGVCWVTSRCRWIEDVRSRLQTGSPELADPVGDTGRTSTGVGGEHGHNLVSNLRVFGEFRYVSRECAWFQAGDRRGFGTGKHEVGQSSKGVAVRSR